MANLRHVALVHTACEVREIRAVSHEDPDSFHLRICCCFRVRTTFEGITMPAGPTSELADVSVADLWGLGPGRPDLSSLTGATAGFRGSRSAFHSPLPSIPRCEFVSGEPREFS